MRASTAESTQETYDRGLTLFATFRSEFQLQSSCPPLDQVVQFVAYMSVKGLAWSTARTYLMGIAFKCKVSGGLDVTQHFLVKKLIEGFRRSTHEKDTRLPISIALLKQLLAILPENGVHLSQIGTDIFLNTLSGALRTFITSSDTVYPKQW